MRITLAELELHRVTASESYAPGSLDFHGAEFRQTAPLKLDATAELLGDGNPHSGALGDPPRIQLRPLPGAVEIPVSCDFDLFYRPMETIAKEEEIEIPDGRVGGWLLLRGRNRIGGRGHRTGDTLCAHEGDLRYRVPGLVPGLQGQSKFDAVQLRTPAARFSFCFAQGRLKREWRDEALFRCEKNYPGVIPWRAAGVHFRAA